MSDPSIYTYLDYRQYLDDIFAARKTETPSFSYRAFARMAESSTPNFLQLVRDRKLNITPATVAALARSLKLSKHEEQYFEALVGFDHAKTHDEKDKHFRRILSERRYREIKQLDEWQFDYFSHWYTPVVRELASSELYPGDPAWIAERIVPEITVAKVKKALKVLESLGLLVHNRESGRWEQADPVVSTPAEVLSVAVVNYHRSMIRLGRDSLERFGPRERDIRAVTLGLSEEGYREVKKRMVAFWRELMAYAEKQTKTDRVWQMNMQLFPVSRDPEAKS